MSLCPTCRTQCEESIPICPVDGTPLVPRDLCGRVLGERYRVLSRIGEGGMGTVYLCEHITLGRRMAVKVLRPEFSADEDVARRFQREAQAASLIGQENIVDVVDFGRASNGSLYFVMEALDGESLASLLCRERPLPTRRALLILAQICRALGAAHARGIVHRDLKPENVFLVPREDGSDLVKVFDFGISKHGTVPEDMRLTRAGSIIGTPEYMAPEQAAASTVDHRCDIYAFGVLAYEMLTGTLPFQGETALATLIKHQSEPPEPPSRRNPSLSPEVEQFILKALVKRPQGRQQNMAEVAEALSRALSAMGMGQVPLARIPIPTLRFSPFGHWPRRPSERGGTMALEPSPAGGEKRGPRLRRMALAGVLVMGLGLAAGLGWRWRSAVALAPPGPPIASATAGVAPAPVLPANDSAEHRGTAAPVSPSPPEVDPPLASAKLVAAAPEASTPHSVNRLERRRAAVRPSRPAAGVRTRFAAEEGENPYGKVDDLKPDPFR